MELYEKIRETNRKWSGKTVKIDLDPEKPFVMGVWGSEFVFEISSDEKGLLLVDQFYGMRKVIPEGWKFTEEKLIVQDRAVVELM